MEFWLTGNITEEKVVGLIQAITACPSPRIIVYINSPGGEYSSAKYLHGFLCELKKEVVTAVVGECQSSAVLILVAGNERWATPVAEFMVHAVYDSWPDEEVKRIIDDGDVGVREYQRVIDACQRAIADCNKFSDEYFGLIASHSNLTSNKIRNKVQGTSSGDWFFTSKEALKMQIIDNIGLPEKVATLEAKAASAKKV